MSTCPDPTSCRQPDFLDAKASLALLGVRPQTLYVCDELMLDAARQHDVIDAARTAGAEIVTVARQAFERVAYREGPDGFLAVVPSVNAHPRMLDLPANPLLLVAEGVETAEQAALLEAEGCDALQGFLFSRARPAPDLTDILTRRTFAPPDRADARSDRTHQRDAA